VEHAARHAQVEKKQIEPFIARVSIEIVSYRTRLCDVDGVSGKAIIDGIVASGLLQDDTTEFVQEVRYRQIKVKNYEEEKTLVIITEVE